MPSFIYVVIRLFKSEETPCGSYITLDEANAAARATIWVQGTFSELLETVNRAGLVTMTAKVDAEEVVTVRVVKFISYEIEIESGQRGEEEKEKIKKVEVEDGSSETTS